MYKTQCIKRTFKRNVLNAFLNGPGLPRRTTVAQLWSGAEACQEGCRVDR